MSEPLENLYFNWLYAKVMPIGNLTPTQSYETLLRTLFTTEFVWLLSGDDNRAEDGKELRGEFLIAADIPDDEFWRLHIPCSVFEMLIGFARRCEFQTDIRAREWFWEMLENLGLRGANDASGVMQDEIQDTLDIFMWRRYRINGDGGLFPLRDPPEDQTQVEVWYQFCAYLVDQDRMP